MGKHFFKHVLITGIYIYIYFSKVFSITSIKQCLFFFDEMRSRLFAPTGHLQNEACGWNL